VVLEVTVQQVEMAAQEVGALVEVLLVFLQMEAAVEVDMVTTARPRLGLLVVMVQGIVQEQVDLQQPVVIHLILQVLFQ
jgi:hypothetical protein